MKGLSFVKNCLRLERAPLKTCFTFVMQERKSWNWNAHINPSLRNPGRREKLKLNFYFHTPLWYLKGFYEGLIISIQLSKRHGTGRVKKRASECMWCKWSKKVMCAKIIQNMVDKGELLAEAVRRIVVLYDQSPPTFKYFILSDFQSRCFLYGFRQSSNFCLDEKIRK